MEQTAKEIQFSRVFDAPRELVWKAWTDPEMIKKWWGPKTFTAPSIQIDLREGGKYLYCMRGKQGPDAPESNFWSAGVFHEIIPNEKIVLTDYFSDEHGNKVDPTTFNMGEDFPSESKITILFEDVDGKTKLTITYDKPATDKQYEAMMKTGMEMGWNQTLDKLADSLKG